jgi:tRNA(fMet)-specific endonuclease VapC
MSLWILDTDHVSLLLERHPKVSRRVAEVGSNVSITVVTVQELFNGWVVRINNATELEDLVRLYGRLSRTISLCKRVPVVEFDGAAGDCYRKILLEHPLYQRNDYRRIYELLRSPSRLGQLSSRAITKIFLRFKG